jgi:hypothetical protein
VGAAARQRIWAYVAAGPAIAAVALIVLGILH